MQVDRFVKFLLSIIALSLVSMVLRPYLAPPAVEARSGAERQLYIEPGTALLRTPDGSRQVLGKVVIDLRSGKVWGFPTLSQDPYPAAGANTTPQTSHPFELGKFAVGDLEK